MCLLSNITNPEYTSQFKLLKDCSSIKVNNILINETIQVTLYDNLSEFRDVVKKIKLLGDLFKMINNQNYNVDLTETSDKKLMYPIYKKMYFAEKALGNKRTKDKSLVRLLESAAILASGISTIFSPKNLK